MSLLTLFFANPAPASTWAIVDDSAGNTTVGHIGYGVYWITKVAGAAAYNAAAVSSLGATGDFVLRVKFLNATSANGYGAGVNSDPLTDDNFASVDHLWLYSVAGGEIRLYTNGSQEAVSVTPGETCWIWRIGSALGMGHGATLALAQVTPDYTTTDTSTLYFDSTFWSVNDQLEALFYFPDLIGQTLTAAQGSATAAISIALTGQSVTAAKGSVTPVSSFALTGQSAVVAQGSIVAASSFALSGQGITAARGSVLAAPSIGITGQGLSAAGGTITPTATVAVSGQSIVAARGSVVASPALELSGQASVVSSGSLLATATLALTGSEITAAQGALVPAFGATLAGQSLIAGKGTVEPGSAPALSGLGVTASRGTIAANDVSIGLTGVSALVAQGQVSGETTYAYLFWNPPPLIGRRKSVSRRH